MRAREPSQRHTVTPHSIPSSGDEKESVTAAVTVPNEASRWYVVETNGQQEAEVCKALGDLGFEAFLPRFRKRRSHGRRVDVVLRPLFPRYLFVRFDPRVQPWQRINYTRGVVRVICANEIPLPVPSGEIEKLRGRCEVQPNGAELLTAAPVVSIKLDSQVRFIDGPFVHQVAQVEAIDDQGRIRLLFELLGKPVRAVAEEGDVTPV
jgi:transcriptional antiterminator RfaH